jgi:predicted Zn finger-like uncharacterized protein
MPSITRCPECNGQLQVPDEFLGRKVKCPTCGAQFTAQAPGSAAAPPPQQPAAAPSPRYRDEDDDEDDYDDEPRPRRKRRRRSRYEPHRGTTILVLGILSLVVCAFLGPFAWVMGNGDMRKIREGTMDPEGEGTTQAGRICGMISTILMIVGCAIYGLIIMIALAGPGARGFR